ncbi:MAG: DUF2339 domain-containing protein [Bdellovibrionales bacterium]|nr:DUF2339 domain-containing protein [Bdellovibrionales bacterium]
MSDTLLAEIIARLDRLEQRIGSLESKAPGKVEPAPGAPEPAPVAQPVLESKKIDLPPLKKPTPINHVSHEHLLSARQTGANDLSRVGKQKNKGGQLLASVAIFFFFLAASLFVKLAIETGWLTPLRQFGGVVLFGFGLLGAGIVLHRKDAPYSGFLSGAGVAMLYFAAYVGSLYFQLYSQVQSVALVILISVGSIVLFTRFGHEYFLMAAVAGSYLAPIIFMGHHFSLVEVGCYLLLLGPTFCIFSFSLSNRRLMAYTSYFGVLVFDAIFASGTPYQTVQPPMMAAIIQGLQFMLFAVCVATYTVTKRIPLSSGEAWCSFPVLLFFYSSEYHMLCYIAPLAAPWIALVFAGVLAALYFGARLSLEGSEFESGPMVTAFVTVILAHAGYIELLPQAYAPFVILGVMLVINSKIFGELRFSQHWVTYLIIYGLAFLEYWKVLLGLNDASQGSLIAMRGLFASVLCLGYFVKSESKNESTWLLWLAILQAMFALVKVAELLTPSIDVYVTSALWSALALLMMVVAVSTYDRALGRSGAALFLIVAAKVFFIDISSHGTVTKIITLLVVGTIIFVGGYFLRMLNDDSAQVHSKKP